jgi:hypothetical protein
MNKKSITVIILFCFSVIACSTLSSLEKKHKKVLLNKPEVISFQKGDTLFSIKKWKTLSPKRFYQKKREISIKNDSLWIKNEKWIAHKIISPNALQEIFRTEFLYINDTFVYEKSEILNLLLFSSSHKTKIRYRLKNGKINIIEKEGPYDLSKYGLEGIK